MLTKNGSSEQHRKVILCREFSTPILLSKR